MKFIKAEKLISKLLEKNLTSMDLDKKIGARENFTYFLCNNKLNPTIEEVKKIVNVLELSAEETYEIFLTFKVVNLQHNKESI